MSDARGYLDDIEELLKIERNLKRYDDIRNRALLSDVHELKKIVK